MASSKDDLILEGEFLLLPKKKVYHVTLTRNGFFFHLVSNNNTTYEEKCIHISDIVGCHSLEQNGSIESEISTPGLASDVDSSPISNNYKNKEVTSSQSRNVQSATDASACGFVPFAYPFKKKMFSSKKVRTRQALSFEVFSGSMKTVDDNSIERKKVAETWRNVINCLCRGLPVNINDIPNCVPPPKGRMLFLINPFSGPGKAATIFKNEIAPMLHEACIPYKAMITEHAGHAGELMKMINLSEWYGVVIVSGDGLVFETINGIMQRDDWASSIKFPVGCLPAGSGNALCCSINYSAGEPLDTSLILHSTFVLLKHRVVPMDLVVVHIPNRTLFSFLSVTWGIVADIDFESEKYRNLGEARFTVGAIKRIIGLRSYRGRISFLPVAEYTPKLTAKSNKVLSKIRRISLQSRSTSKSTLDSNDSKSSNSSQCSNNISQNETKVWNAEQDTGQEVDLNNEIDSSVDMKNDSSNRNLVDISSKSELNTHISGAISIQHSTLIHDGSGDAKAVDSANQNRTGSSRSDRENSTSQQISDSESPFSEKANSGGVSNSQIENIANSSNLSNDTLINGNKCGSTSNDLQLNRSQAHSASGQAVNGCNIENKHRMTILSDSKEVKVEQETYRVKKADYSPVPTPLLPPLDQDVPSNWVTLDENFVLAIAVYQTHLGSDMFAAPDAHLSDGLIHLMMVQEGIPRNALLNLFLTFDQGRHILSPYVEVVKVLAFRFEPASKDGNIMVDGERFDPVPIQGQILPGLARIMAIK